MEMIALIVELRFSGNSVPIEANPQTRAGLLLKKQLAIS